ncbi:molybdenum cofactor guanylyltransferase [Brevibacillus ginsengisoli]|uniref:molybdenum cofactor guanylyltransferase n=1 Tax=Brevibacillus ginsengisoli TaxID=363854 RepID=UPI003CFB42E1
MLSGVILAGGKGTRMGGRNKALLQLDGKPLLERQLAVMQRICSDIVIVANDPEAIRPVIQSRTPFASDCDIQIVPDLYLECGPLGGIHAALPHCRNEAAWLVGCDMPFISEQAAQYMFAIWQKQQADVVIPADGEMLHPLHGIYAKHIHATVEEMLQMKQYRIQRLLSGLHTITIDFSGNEHSLSNSPPFWTNINTPDDYASALQK